MAKVRHETESLKEAFAVICLQPVEDDGLIFDPAGMRISEIRIKNEYGGLRVRLTATLGTARIPLQIDVGFGDAITPAATHEEFPSMLGQPRARIRAYPRETVIAEKYQAMVERGMTTRGSRIITISGICRAISNSRGRCWRRQFVRLSGEEILRCLKNCLSV